MRRSVLEFGAVGDGLTNDARAFQTALDSGCGEVFVPCGRYAIFETLRVPSHTKIIAEPTARILLSGDKRKKAGDFLLTNADHENGNEAISIQGGVWDGNHGDPINDKPEIDDLNGYSGTVLNFYRVKDLTLSDLTVANSVTYNVRMARVDGFHIENIGFLSDRPAYNQDGLHFNGWVKNGVIRNVRALSDGQTNDDMIAFNADDCIERCENVGMECGDIENIEVDGVYADNCYTAIRLLSFRSKIRNITVRNLYTGFRAYAVNGDAARYCRRPIFRESDYPEGVGHIENVLFENWTCFCTSEHPVTPGAIDMESFCHGVEFRNFRFLKNGKSDMKCAYFQRKLPGQTLTADGIGMETATYGETLSLEDFKDLILH